MKDPDPSRVDTTQDLAHCLLQLHIWADRPSLRTLEQQTGMNAGRQLACGGLKSVRLGRTSLHDVLNGNKFPKKAFLLTFVEACGIDVAADRRWEEAWNRIASQSVGHIAVRDHDPRQEMTQAVDRAERAEAENRRLRREIAQIRVRAEQTEAANLELLRQAAPAGRFGQAAAGQNALIAARSVEPLRRWDPERVGPFAVLGRMGAGSMGQVYLGRSAAGRLVAIKTIRVELAEEAGFRRQFAQEVEAARKVSGVFTAAVVDAEPDADLPWLATAFVPAPSLHRMVMACGPLPVHAVRWLAAGGAEALASIHGTGLVHRDLKPSNVLVAPDGPRVIDFGVARAADRMNDTTSRGTVGTPAYIAPEQARDPRQASLASDVYALGATLLFAATGHPPYQATSATDVLAQLATEKPDLSGLPSELTDLITACLDREPRNRPTTSAMLTQLGPFTQTGGPAVEHTYLPEPAMALITQYQRSPQQTALAQADEERSLDETCGSLPRLPAEAASGPPLRRRPEPASPARPANRGEPRRARVLKAISRRKES